MKRRIFVMGGDRGGWALDTEARLARECLARIPSLELVDNLYSAEVVHTVWPEQLLEDPACAAVIRSGRPVVASFSNDPWALFERVPGFFSAARQWTCVAQSSKARRELEALRIEKVKQVAYVADFAKFPVRAVSRAESAELRRSLGLPADAYLISSFQRDTEGKDLSRLKVQKGPDIFAGILLEAQRRLGRGKVHVVLGGPRRHWLRAALRRHDIPFTFLGRETAEDDYPWQTLPLAEVARVLAACDLNLVTSRWEGAPRAIMECVALGVPVLSSAEGIAEDLLDPPNIFRSLPEAVEKLVADVREGGLRALLPVQAARLEANHSVAAVSAQWAKVYARDFSGGRASLLRDYPVHHPRLHRWVRRWKAWEARLLRSAGLARKSPAFTEYPSITAWLADVRAGKKAACPMILRPVPNARALSDRLVVSNDLGAIREALAARVPVVYREDPEARELVGYGGIAHDGSEEGLRNALKTAEEFREGLALACLAPEDGERRRRLESLADFAARGLA